MRIAGCGNGSPFERVSRKGREEWETHFGVYSTEERHRSSDIRDMWYFIDIAIPIIRNAFDDNKIIHQGSRHY